MFHRYNIWMKEGLVSLTPSYSLRGTLKISLSPRHNCSAQAVCLCVCGQCECGWLCGWGEYKVVGCTPRVSVWRPARKRAPTSICVRYESVWIDNAAPAGSKWAPTCPFVISAWLDPWPVKPLAQRWVLRRIQGPKRRGDSPPTHISHAHCRPHTTHRQLCNNQLSLSFRWPTFLLPHTSTSSGLKSARQAFECTSRRTVEDQSCGWNWVELSIREMENRY